MLMYGAGGHAKVIFRMLIEAGVMVETVFDDRFYTRFFDRGTVRYSPEIFKDKKLIIAIGDNYARRVVAGKVSHIFGRLIHQSTLIDSTVMIGQGTVVCHQAIIQADARIGEHVIINTGAIVEHECELKNFVHVAPRVTICGNVKVDENTLLGAGCIILPNISIGKNCIVGAGSVVTKSILDNIKVAGNPARILSF